MLLNHSSLAVRELVGLARWLEARYFVTLDFVVGAVAAAVTNEAAENAVVGFEIVVAVVEFVFVVVVAVVVALNTVGFVGAALGPG